MSRKLLLIILIPAVLLLGGYLFLRFTLHAANKDDEKKTGELMPAIDSLGGKKVSPADLRPLFIERVQLLLKKSSNNLYKLSIGDMEVDVLASTLVLKNVKMEPDAANLDSLRKFSEAPNEIYTASFDELHIEGINLDDAINSKAMDYKLVKLVRPVVSIHRQKGQGKNETVQKEKFSQGFLKEMEKLSIKKLVVEEGEIIIYNEVKNRKPTKLKQVSVVLNNFLLDSATRDDKNRFLFAEEASLSFKDYEKLSSDGLYKLKIGTTTIKAPQQQITLTNFSFTSPFSKAEFVKKQKHSKELYNLVLPSVTFSGVDWWTLLNEEEVIADEINIPGGKFSIYLNRSLPPKSKMGNFPNQLIMKTPLKMNIAKLKMSNVDLTYEEYNPLSQQSGTLYFDNVNLDITNVSNINQKPMKAKGSAMFMHKVPLDADFVFDMINYKTGKFSAALKMQGFDGSMVNSFAMPVGMMKIEKGTVQDVKANINGDQWKASGDVMLLYKDLKLSLLEKDKGEKVLDKKGFTTLVANLFVLKKSNPAGSDAARKEQANFNRNPHGGFFMLIWKTALVGILKTIGAPEKIASKKTVAPAKK